MWKDEKTEYLRKNRDYARLLSGDDAEPRSRDRDNDRGGNDMDDDDGSRKRHRDYHDRRSRLKELERQKLTKGKNGFYANGDRETEGKGHAKVNGGSTSKAEGGASSSKDKKKLPYDRSFGSFFGPSEPVVAKRIIEEARARQEAEIVAAREARANREAERKKAAERMAAGTSNREKKPVPKAKPIDQAALRARKLKEARDFAAFLFEDTPLPPPKADKNGASASKAGTDVRGDSGKPSPINTPARRAPLPAKSAQGSRVAERPSSSSRPLQTPTKSSMSKPSQTSRPSSGQAARGNTRPLDRTVSLNKPKQSSSGKPLSSKKSATGSGRPDPRRDADPRKEAAMRKLVAGSPASNGGKNSSSDRRAPAPKSTERRVSSSQGPDRRLSQSTDRRPVSQASERRSGPSQVPMKGSQASASGRPVGGGIDPRRAPASQAGRQSMQSRPPAKPAVRPAPASHNKPKYADDPRREPRRDPRREEIRRDEVVRRRARSPSGESDERPCKKVDINRRRARSPSEESDDRPRKKVNINRRRDMYEEEEDDDDDSFIDDDEDQTQVSNMIRKMFRYDPSKYRGEDDLDDRGMEADFRTIQAEERRSAREARLEDERELALIEEEEKQERLRKLKKKRKLTDR